MFFSFLFDEDLKKAIAMEYRTLRDDRVSACQLRASLRHWSCQLAKNELLMPITMGIRKFARPESNPIYMYEMRHQDLIYEHYDKSFILINAK